MVSSELLLRLCCLYIFPAAFHATIVYAIPHLVSLLSDLYCCVQIATANTIAKLTKHDTSVFDLLLRLLLLIVFPAEFHAVISDATPQLLQLLQHNSWSVQVAGVNTIVKLAGHGIFCTIIEVLSLMHISSCDPCCEHPTCFSTAEGHSF